MFITKKHLEERANAYTKEALFGVLSLKDPSYNTFYDKLYKTYLKGYNDYATDLNVPFSHIKKAYCTIKDMLVELKERLKK